MMCYLNCKVQNVSLHTLIIKTQTTLVKNATLKTAIETLQITFLLLQSINIDVIKSLNQLFI